VLLADVPAFLIAVCAAFTLRFDFYFLQNRPEFVPYLVMVLLVKPTVFLLSGMYQRLWRYATVQDLTALIIANSTASAAMGVLVAISVYRYYIYEFSRSVLVADWLFAICTTAVVRLSIRVAGESRQRRSRNPAGVKRVLVIGAGDAGAIMTREMQRNSQLGMQPIAFLDDDAVKRGKRIYGVPVVGPLADLQRVVEERRVDEVIIAMPRTQGTVLRSIADDCRAANVVFRTMPGMYELLDGKVSVNRLRQVDITDLLRRTPIEIEPGSANYVQGRIVVVTGGGGSIGSELSRQVAHARPRRLVLLGHGENSIFDAKIRLRESCPDVAIDAVIADIRDRMRLARVFADIHPDIVFHAAAHKHVPLMEENPEEAISNNVLGTRNVVDSALGMGCERLVMISTDKAVTPSSVMGASKRVAEALVQEAGRRAGRPFVVVRFGNVLGSRGSVVPTFKRHIEAGGPIPITHPDMKRFFMTIPEAVHLVVHAGGIGRGGELFVLKMGEPLRIVQLAQDLIRLSGLASDEIPIVFTGLRPGEKLEESLWEDGAVVENTEHPDVLRVRESDLIDPARLSAYVESLSEAARVGDARLLESLLADLIPSFTEARQRPAIQVH
jgi:FlaA1/EpsC-like NDP-sugar epimerase